MRLSLVISGMGAGGAERVMKTLAEAWLSEGHDITLITLARVEDDFLRCDPRVRRVGLDLLAESGSLAQALANNLQRVRALRRALADSRPSAVISFTDQTNVLAILAAWGLKLPVIACEHIDPFQHNIGALWDRLRRLAYPRAAAVVGVTAAAERFARQFVHGRPVLTIPNPVLPPNLPQPLPPRPWPAGPTLIGMGRLNRQKGFDLLLEAMAGLPPQMASWRLVILGEGEERASLEAQGQALGLAGRVHLLGRVAQPLPLLAQADIFVLPSRYEGFPMALMEALSVGLPALCMDCASGVREILRPEVDGLITPPGDVEAFGQGLVRLMGDAALRARLATAAPQVLQRFGLEAVLEHWRRLFARLGLS